RRALGLVRRADGQRRHVDHEPGPPRRAVSPGAPPGRARRDQLHADEQPGSLSRHRTRWGRRVMGWMLACLVSAAVAHLIGFLLAYPCAWLVASVLAAAGV